MPKPYHLSPEGTDVWRRFVIPVPLTEQRYVRAVELRPGSKRIVHHAIAYIDSTDSSRRLEPKDGEPGYDGMVGTDAHSPDGHFLSWLPGMIPYSEDPEMAWRLEPGTDFVVETHMLPSGKPEAVQISVGLYFTNQLPSKHPVRLLLHSEEIDIPAGATDVAVADSYVLPVEVQLLGMHPHAHLLGKQVEAWATFPDNTKKTLLDIPHWDFAWQNSYRLKKPATLPAGTRLSMRVGFDNSADNVRNPHHPPQRVHFGFHSYDEMAQMTIQVLPRNAADARELAADFRKRELFATIKGDIFRLKFDADDERLQTDLGQDLFAVGRRQEAMEHLQEALKLNPKSAKAHYCLGAIYYRANDLNAAKSEYEAAVKADPDFYLAQAELGLWHLQQGDLERAKEHLTRSLKTHPQDAVTRNNLAIIYFQEGSIEAAHQQIVEALRIDPNYGPARDNLKKLEAVRQK
jgi:thioredoxin-like negative regulator of GroEL